MNEAHLPAAPDKTSTLETPQRQSLWAVGFLALRTVRQIGLIQLGLAIGFLIARLPSLLALIAVVALIGVGLFVVAALQWWRYTFCIVGDELVVERGVLQRQTLSIPLGRVQSVSLEQKLLHRIISLVQISLDTAGTETAEFVIDAVDRSVALELQGVVANYRGRTAANPSDQPEVPVAPPEQVHVKHPPNRILKVALTQTPFAGLVLIAPLVAFASEIGEFVPFDLPEIEAQEPGGWLLWFVPAVLLGGFLVSVLLNLVRVLLTEWDLTIRSTESGLRRDAGLLSTTSVAAPVPRVQMISLRQGVLERAASIRTVRLHTIGATNFAVPGCTEQQAETLRSLVLADSPGVENLTERVSTAQVFRDTRNSAAGAAPVGLVLWFFVGWWSLLIVALVPLEWATARREVRLRRWGWTAEAVADHRQLFGWRRHELLIRKLNGVTVRQSLFERKRDLATVTVATAAGTVSIGMIPIGQAELLRDEFLRSVETDRRAWM